MREMKEAGLEYEERMEELEKVEHPKPLRDFIYETFNSFSDRHPWVGQENIRPKSIAREMFETFQNFPEYIREYDLQRAEGVLLRYLSEAYKALVQTVPDQFKTEPVLDIVEYFGAIVRGVDSSLLEEWEKLRDPSYVSKKTFAVAENEEEDRERVRGAEKAWRRQVMIEVYSFMRLLATGAFEEAIASLENADEWTEKKLGELAARYGDSGHGALRTDPAARHPSLTEIEVGSSAAAGAATAGAGADANADVGAAVEGLWTIRQRLVDPDEHNDWELVFETSGPGVHSVRLKLLKLGEV
jgi:hypothetical protein